MDTFERIEAVARLMASFPKPWYVAGGWAIDLFIGRVTREHEDLEVAVCRRDQGVLQAHLADWTWHKAAPREAAPPEDEWDLVPWEAGEWLELPIHQIYARRAHDEVGFFLNEVADGEWRFRRNEQIRRPEGAVGMLSSRGIPIVAPEIMLAYKAKLFRPKDRHDFDVSHPLLSAGQRAWLKQTLVICHSDHPWIERL